VVLHMALKIKPDILVVFNDTGVEYPETYAYIERMTKEWNLNLFRTKPLLTFWQCVRKYGFPMIRRTGRPKQDGYQRRHYQPACCRWLKEWPAKEAFKAKGVQVNLTGLRVGESRARMFTIGRLGQVYDHTHLKVKVAHPIAFWTTKQVDSYIEKHEIPLNEAYLKGQERVGCWPCTGYLTWRESLAKTHPEMYRALMHVRGEMLITDYEQEVLTQECK